MLSKTFLTLINSYKANILLLYTIYTKKFLNQGAKNLPQSSIKKVSQSHDGGRYHIETSPLVCSVNQWTGFYKITAPS